jgi:hypothetical protein
MEHTPLPVYSPAQTHYFDALVSMAKSNKWTVRYGYCELEILWTHKQVILTRYPGGKKSWKKSGFTWAPETVNMSAKGFSVIAKGFLKRWETFKKSKKYRRYTS